jgi:hypothetical protein
MPSNNPNILIDISNDIGFNKSISKQYSNNIFNNIFIEHYDILRENSVLIDFSKDSWIYNPQQLCIDYYNDFSLYKIVMMVNNILSISQFYMTNFKNNKILMPPFNRIRELVSFL